MKLPKPRKRGEVYRIEIMLDGKRLSTTRDTAKECEAWVAQKILEHKAMAYEEKVQQSISLEQLLNLYYSNVGKNKPSHRTNSLYTKVFIRDFPILTSLPIHEITPKHLSDWRNTRLQGVSAGTARREISFLSAVFSYAVKELFMLESNPFMQVQKPAMPKPRSRRISDDDIAAIKQAGNWTDSTPSQSQQWAVWVFLFAIATAMRQSEILDIKKADIKDGYIHLPKTKNGETPTLARSATKITLSYIKPKSHIL